MRSREAGGRAGSAPSSDAAPPKRRPVKPQLSSADTETPAARRKRSAAEPAGATDGDGEPTRVRSRQPQAGRPKTSRPASSDPAAKTGPSGAAAKSSATQRTRSQSAEGGDAAEPRERAPQPRRRPTESARPAAPASHDKKTPASRSAGSAQAGKAPAERDKPASRSSSTPSSGPPSSATDGARTASKRRESNQSPPSSGGSASRGAAAKDRPARDASAGNSASPNSASRNTPSRKPASPDSTGRDQQVRDKSTGDRAPRAGADREGAPRESAGRGAAGRSEGRRASGPSDASTPRAASAPKETPDRAAEGRERRPAAEGGTSRTEHKSSARSSESRGAKAERPRDSHDRPARAHQAAERQPEGDSAGDDASTSLSPTPRTAVTRAPAAAGRAPTRELTAEEAANGFAEFNIGPATLIAIHAAGYRQPTPVQAGVIPRALAGENVIGQAQTGTGKTAAFIIPVIESVPPGEQAHPRALVLVPTRELAEQVEGEFTKLAGGSGLKSAVLVGGKPMKRQLSQLQRYPELVVGTPGRVLDHLKRGSLKLDNVTLAILDEADRMLDIGFRPDIERILRRCPKERQTLLLSATVAPEVLRLAERYMIDPVHLNFSPSRVSVDSVVQKYFTVADRDKLDLLIYLLRREEPAQAIIFCRTKRGADTVHRQLKKIFAADIGVMHGDLQQSERTRVLQQLRDSQLRFLVATDVVGRGIDVSGISHIINFDIPFSSDDYVHRVGRTGRMGREGTAYTFVTLDEGERLTEIEKLINILLIKDEWPRDQQPAESPEAAAADSGKPAAATPEPRPVSGLLRSGRGQKKYRRGL